MAIPAELDEIAESGDIFISYNRDDSDFRAQLEGLLRENGYNPEIDKHGIASGEDWEHRLREMIGGCDTFIAVLTAEWAASENCRKEFAIALETGTRIIPVLPRALPDNPSASTDEIDARKTIAALNYIHFFSVRQGDGDGFYTGSLKLKRALSDDMEQLRLRRRYEKRARAWNRGEDDLLSGDQLTQAESWQKKERTEGVSERIAEYIAASADAREAAERSARRNRNILAGLGVFAVVATVLAGGTAWFAYRSVDLADRDTELLSEAAENWALGKSELASATAGPVDPNFDTFLGNAVGRLSESLRAIADVERDGVKPLKHKVSLDLSKAHFNLKNYTESLEVIDTLQSEFELGTADSQAKLLMARALIACQLGNETASLQAELANASDSVRNAYSLEALGSWASPHPLSCDAAIAAVCQASPGCVDQVTDSQLNTDPNTPVSEPGSQPDLTGEGSETVEPEAPMKPADDPESAFKIRDIYLHISEDAQREDAKALSRMLTEQGGYRVLGIELVPAPAGRNRSVRYYYAEQEAQAEKLRGICATLSTNLNRAAWTDEDSYRVISLAGRYDNLPKNRIEIWL